MQSPRYKLLSCTDLTANKNRPKMRPDALHLQPHPPHGLIVSKDLEL
jgi:hypothetical protein